MTITINVVTETPLEGERIRRFKGENPDVLLQQVEDYLSWAVPKAAVKTAPKKAVAKQAAVKTVPKKAVKSKKR